MNKELFYRTVEEICPSHLAEDWDNCGIQVNTASEEVRSVLVSLEVTGNVIEEAVSRKCDMIVTHHPLIFGSLNNIDNNNIIGNYLIKLLDNDISVYSCHTSFDAMEGGNNDCFGEIAGFEDIEVFSRDVPFLRKGRTSSEITFSRLISDLAHKLQTEPRFFSVTGDPDRPINTVAWCTGAGAEYLEAAYEEGCDLYITGDVKYHQAQMAKAMGICLLDAGHYAMEKIFVDNMAGLLEKGTDCKIIKSNIDINPFI